MQHISSRLARRAGFTLVELLVVIVILTILAAILIPAVFAAQAAATRGAIATEIGDMVQALERYKIDVGEYPPNITTASLATAKAHVRLKFRSWDSVNDPLPAQLDAAETLVFWLRGFKNDSVRPIGGTDATGRTSFYDFTATRLVSGVGANGYPVYIPMRVNTGTSPPYAYFENRTYATVTYAAPSGRGAGTAKPYAAAGTPPYAEPTKFQIVFAGLDSDYGSGGTYPVGTGYAKGDMDNLTNFSVGKTLGDSIR